MPRILWLTDNYPPQRGGMAQSCDRIIDGLRKTGDEIEIIHFVDKQKSLTRKQQVNGGYTAIAFDHSEAHVLNITWNYISALGNFDYIVCFGGYLSMIGAPIFSKWMSTPLISMIRGNDFDVSIFTPRKRGVLEDLLVQSKHVLTVSSDKAFKIEKWLSHPSAHFIANSIDTEQWQPSASEVKFAEEWRNSQGKDRIKLGIFGHLKAKKGVDFFLDALSKTSLIDKTHLLLIGETEEHLEESLNTTDFSYSLLSFHDRYELMKYYLCCDALIIPSFYEGMPNVLLEAGALGIPVIASAVDGMKDVIQHKENGLLFSANNADECRKTLHYFCSLKRDEQLQLGQSIQSTIINAYTPKHETDAYKKFLV